MQDTDRFKLLFGPYETPLFEYGEIVRCECRGEVKIVGITDAKIPWPIGQKGSSRSLVIYCSLAEAVRRESNLAVAHYGDWLRLFGRHHSRDHYTRLWNDEPFADDPWLVRRILGEACPLRLRIATALAI
jgi:hypothetical protein